MKPTLILLLFLLFAAMGVSAQTDTTSGSLRVRKENADTTRLGSDARPVSFAAIMPSFPGSFNQWLIRNMEYPQEAREKGMEGTATYSVTITTSGEVQDAEIKNSSGHALLDEAGLKAIQKMPKWNPGLNRGQPVAVRITIPVGFHLDR